MGSIGNGFIDGRWCETSEANLEWRLRSTANGEQAVVYGTWVTGWIRSGEQKESDVGDDRVR